MHLPQLATRQAQGYVPSDCECGNDIHNGPEAARRSGRVRTCAGGISVTKQLCMTIAVLVYVAAWPAPASAQEWPRSPIRIIVAFGAGGGADIIGRILGQAMQ